MVPASCSAIRLTAICNLALWYAAITQPLFCIVRGSCCALVSIGLEAPWQLCGGMMRQPICSKGLHKL
jgi:hypothetical protein